MSDNGWQAFFNGTAYKYMNEEYAKPWQEEVDFYLEILDLKPGSRILDLGCGPGRHTVEFARRGYQVTGVDFSESMLDEARAAAHQAKVNIELICCDATEYEATHLYDGCICMLEACIGYITPDQEPLQHDLAILRNVNHALKSNACFILGITNAFKSVRQYGQDAVETGYFDPTQMIHQFTLTWKKSDGTEEQAHLRKRDYFPPEITMLLQQANFEVEHIWGGTYGRGPIILDDYMITVVSKKTGHAD